MEMKKKSRSGGFDDAPKQHNALIKCEKVSRSVQLLHNLATLKVKTIDFPCQLSIVEAASREKRLGKQRKSARLDALGKKKKAVDGNESPIVLGNVNFGEIDRGMALSENEKLLIEVNETWVWWRDVWMIFLGKE